jgi:hypothetical protein
MRYCMLLVARLNTERLFGSDLRVTDQAAGCLCRLPQLNRFGEQAAVYSTNAVAAVAGHFEPAQGRVVPY